MIKLVIHSAGQELLHVLLSRRLREQPFVCTAECETMIYKNADSRSLKHGTARYAWRVRLTQQVSLHI
jgi:hypothetical protein